MNPFGLLDKILAGAIVALSIALGLEWAHVKAVQVELAHAKTQTQQIQTELANYKESVSETTRLLQAANDRSHAAQLTKIQEALNAATVRNTKLAADAAGVQSQLDRLRSAVRLAARRDSVPSATVAPDDQPTSTVGQLFLECAAAYGQLAATADRHASDVQTLTESWPR